MYDVGLVGRMNRSTANRRMKGNQGNQNNTLMFVGRVLGHVWLYEERYFGGGGA